MKLLLLSLALQGLQKKTWLASCEAMLNGGLLTSHGLAVTLGTVSFAVIRVQIKYNVSNGQMSVSADVLGQLYTPFKSSQ